MLPIKDFTNKAFLEELEKHLKLVIEYHILSFQTEYIYLNFLYMFL